jgi:hypothetical protein
MIIVWLTQLAVWLMKLFIPPSFWPPKPQTFLEAMDKCPCCGSGSRVVKTVTVSSHPGMDGGIRKTQLLFTCQVCEGWVFMDTLAGSDAAKLHGREMSGLG